MIAGQDIATTVAGVNLSTSSATGNSGNIAIIAGAAYQISANTVTITGPTTKVIIVGEAPTPVGGQIDFNTNGIASLSSQSTAATGNGGTMTIAAFGGIAAGAGLVSINPAVTINSSGSALGTNNGNITIVAASNVTVGNLTASALGTNTGAITLQTSQPSTNLVISTGLGAGTVQSGNLTLGPLTAKASIVAGDITTPGSITVNAG